MELDVISIIVGIATAVILGITYMTYSLHFKHQSKIDIANFYSDYDTKLRNLDKELRLLFYNQHVQVYHYMTQIIVTLNTVFLVKNELKVDIKLSQFNEWFKYGLELKLEYFEQHRDLDPGDRKAITKFTKSCSTQNISNDGEEKILPPCVNCVGYVYDNLK